MPCVDLPSTVASDSFDIAARLAPHSGLCILQGFCRDGSTLLAVRPLESCSHLDPEPGTTQLTPRVTKPELADLPRWVGVIPYEALRDVERSSTRSADLRAPPHHTTPHWWRYGAFVKLGRTVQILGDDPGAVKELVELVHQPAAPLGTASARRLPDAYAKPRHVERIHQALEEIVAGEYYQICLARRIQLRVQGDPLALFRAISSPSAERFTAFIQTPEGDVMAASPELLVDIDASRRIKTSPIKGTRPRSPDIAQDRAWLKALEDDPKEQAELNMVIDVERNDLGRVAAIGSVRVSEAPRIVSLPTVHHRLATIEAQLRPDVTRSEWMHALLPSGSVTGAPKIRAMEAIARLEAHRRGLYTGAFGVIRHDQSTTLAMAIRTLTHRNGDAHYFTGGGIIYGCKPEQEWLETQWKAVALQSLNNSA